MSIVLCLKKSKHWSVLTDDNTVTGQFFCQVHLVAGRALNEVDVGDFIADVHKCRCRGVEKAAVGDTRHRETPGGSEHDAGGWCAGIQHVWCCSGDVGRDVALLVR